MYCGVYTEEPYDENGTLVAEPILSGLTPISTNLMIGNYVEKIYIVTRNGVIEKDVADINEDLSTAKTRSMENTPLPEKIKNMCDQAFPELMWNLKKEDLYTCTGMTLTKATDLNITFINASTNIDGILYMYTYPATITEPTLNDCTFYGIDQNTGERVRLDGVPEEPIRPNANSTTFTRPLSMNNYIFSNKEELKNKKVNRTAKFGTFEPGIKVGFCYMDIYTLVKNGKGYFHRSFTTPCLNDATHSLNITSKNDPDFVYTKPVSQGCMKVNDLDGKKHIILGMENSFPDGDGYDADFNDMLCIIEYDPKAMRLTEEVPALDLEAYKYARGYYLFEDNYPKKGDYDFNDVVIQYEIKTYLNRPSFRDDCNEVKVALLAYGCSMSNEFGFYVDYKDDTASGKFIPVFKNIHGYVNVDANDTGEAIDPSTFRFSETLHFAGKITGTNGDGAKIRPYLKNQPDKIKNQTLSSATLLLVKR